MIENNTILKIEGLNKKLGDFQIKDLSFSLDAGFIMGFIGRNGSGKTTVMKLIQNVLVKDTGTVTICGFDNGKHEIQAKDEIGFVMDHAPFIKNYTLNENAELFGKYYTQFYMDQFEYYLRRFHIDGEKNLLELSKGMETKFQLAFALAHSPKLLILDEPTDGLDPVFRRSFLLLMQELIEEEKMAVLFSTHITSDLDKIADFVTMIDNGEILFSDRKDNVLEKYRIIRGDKVILKEIPNNKFIAVRQYNSGFEGLTEHYNEIKCYLSNSNSYLIEQASLEDIMYFISKGRRKIIE